MSSTQIDRTFRAWAKNLPFDYSETEYFIGPRRLYGQVTSELVNHLQAHYSAPTSDHYIECLYDLKDSSKLLFERFNSETKVSEHILAVKEEEIVNDSSIAVNWELYNESPKIEALLAKKITDYSRFLTWGTTEQCFDNKVWIEYLNWGCRGHFGAYAVATLTDPDQELLQLWRPCATKHLAVMKALKPLDLVDYLTESEYARNSFMLEDYPPHDGKNGVPPYPGYPPGNPMNVEEAAQIFLQDDDWAEDDDRN